MMVHLRMFRDASVLFCVFTGIILTSIYFLIIGNLNNHYGTFTINNNYEEICKDWRLEQNKILFEIDQSELRNEILPDISNNNNKVIIEKNPFPDHFRCDNSYKEKIVVQRGDYYIIYNFVKAQKEFDCTESITLSAPGDFRFLDNVIHLAERWRGPISIGLFAPGEDFYTTIKSIAYLRKCKSEFVKDYVSFHIVFNQKHTPQIKNNTILISAYKEEFNCSEEPPWETVNDEDMYKTKHGLFYPINIVRNIAKIAAQTYFVFPNDIELYPTRNFIPLFLEFVRTNLHLFTPENRQVFVLPVFEILANETIPENKTDLLKMLKKKSAIIFHQTVCIVCHRVVESEKWVRSQETKGLSVFSVGKRIGRYMVWEPFFVCTQKEPLWDERLTWEGQNNKMMQAYTLCIMDYDFQVLDNAFLIHKPGVKKKKVQITKFNKEVRNTNILIRNISTELQNLYGYHANCTTKYTSVLGKNKTKKDETSTKLAQMKNNN